MYVKQSPRLFKVEALSHRCQTQPGSYPTEALTSLGLALDAREMTLFSVVSELSHHGNRRLRGFLINLQSVDQR